MAYLEKEGPRRRIRPTARFLARHYNVAVSWSDMEGVVIETETPKVIEALKEYLKWLKSNVCMRREDAWSRLPVDELIISVKGTTNNLLFSFIQFLSSQRPIHPLGPTLNGISERPYGAVIQRREVERGGLRC